MRSTVSGKDPGTLWIESLVGTTADLDAIAKK
jgi:hypothetical protein